MNGPRIVLITGATGTLGESAARAFLEAGDIVVLSGRNGGRLADLRGDLAHLGTVATAAGDVTTPEGAERVVADVVQRHGKIDCLIHLVGEFAIESIASVPADLWTKLLTTNALSAAYLCRATLPGMVQRKYGKVVFVSSRTVAAPPALFGPYTASKAALEAIAKSAAAEVKGTGVNVNVAAITTLDSPEARKSMPNANPSSFVSPADLAQTILFLCSPQAASINGAVIPIGS